MSCQDVSFRCDYLVNVFETIMKNVEKGLPLSVPEELKSIMYVYFIQDKLKPVLIPKLPLNTILVDMQHEPIKTLETIRSILKKDTDEFINDIDAGIVKKLTLPEFHYLLMCILYLKGSWNGIRIGPVPFFNKNGTVTENIQFFKLSENLAEVTPDNRLVVKVPYSNYGEVHFSKILNQDEIQGYNWVDAYLPECSFETVLEIGSLAIQFKYKQDEKGFQLAAGAYMIGYGMPNQIKDVYFNGPFKIEVFHYCIKNDIFNKKLIKIVEMDINNLE